MKALAFRVTALLLAATPVPARAIPVLDLWALALPSLLLAAWGAKRFR